jgi:hypothetical protein
MEMVEEMGDLAMEMASPAMRMTHLATTEAKAAISLGQQGLALWLGATAISLLTFHRRRLLYH